MNRTGVIFSRHHPEGYSPTQYAPHICTDESCPADGGYYVSCTDAGKLWLMSGPYQTHASALADVDAALKIADAIDGRSWFMGWGTIHRKDDYRKPGRLNAIGYALPLKKAGA